MTSWRWLRGTNRWDDPEIADIVAGLKATIEGSGPDVDETRQEILRGIIARRDIDARPFRVLYTADDRMTAWVEVLQEYRRAPSDLSRGILDEIRRFQQTDESVKFVTGLRSGILPAEDLEGLYIGEMSIEPAPFVQVEAMQSVQFLRAQLLEAAHRLGIKDVTLGHILGDDRKFTQLVAKVIHDAPEFFAGIHHDSTHGRPHGNWAIFEGRATTTLIASQRVEIGDPDLQRAVEVLDIEIEGAPPQSREVNAKRRGRDADRDRDDLDGPSLE